MATSKTNPNKHKERYRFYAMDIEVVPVKIGRVTRWFDKETNGDKVRTARWTRKEKI